MINYNEQSRITKYMGNGVPTIARIMDINNSGDRVKLVRYGWVDVADCLPPLIEGDKVMYDEEVLTVTEVAPSEDGFSVGDWKSFSTDDGFSHDYACGTDLNFELISGSEIVEEAQGLSDKPEFKDIKEFLKDCNYSFSPKVVSGIVEDAYEAKTKLREKFRKSKFWNEELQALIVPNFTFENKPDYDLVKKWAKSIISASYSAIHKNINDNVYYAALSALDTFIYKNKVYLNDGTAEALETCIPNYRYAVGQKLSKFFRGIFDGINPDGYTSYEHDYAILADAASPKTLERTLVISLNIMDFLNMSEGNSWDSCHNIHKRGCYHGGCLSYALDEVTAILYTLPSDVDISKGGLWRHKRINRQLFMFGDTFVVESRLYPKHEDANIRKAHSDIVRQIYCGEIMGKRFNPIKTSSEEVAKIISKITETQGLHYPDYKYDCYHIGIMKSDDFKDDAEKITIGAKSPDIVSGEINHDHERMTSYGNTNANHSLAYEDYETGELIYDENDAELLDGRMYHRENLVWCDYEEEYALSDDVVWIGDYAYTREHADENFVRCSHCDEYIRTDDAIFTADGDAYCEDCASYYLSQCEECGEYYKTDDMEYVDDAYYCPDCLDSATKVCSVCGERHINSMFEEGSDICSECVGQRPVTELPSNSVIVCKTIREVKCVLRAASSADIKWRSGEEAIGRNIVDILRRTLLNPNVNGIGIVVGDSLSYTILGSSLAMPDNLGRVINFADMTLTTTA